MMRVGTSPSCLLVGLMSSRWVRFHGRAGQPVRTRRVAVWRAVPTGPDGRMPTRLRHARVMLFGCASRADGDHISVAQFRDPVKRPNLDRHPEPPTRRQTGEVLAKIDISVTCTNVNDQLFGSVYPQPPPGGSGRILQTRSSDPPGSVVLSQGRNFPSRIETRTSPRPPHGRRPSQGRNFPSRIETFVGQSSLVWLSRRAGTFRVGLKLLVSLLSTEDGGRRAGTFRVGLKPRCICLRKKKAVAGQELSESD